MQKKTKKALRNKNTEHISNEQYDKLLTIIFERIKADETCFKKLVSDIEKKNERIDFLDDYVENEIDKLNKLIEERTLEYKKANVHLVDINADLQKKNIEITRAYNGLAMMGKFAVENGIDIKKHNRELPEHPLSKYKFSQKHEVLESGKTRSTWHLTPNKKRKKKND
jgi:hypoxanthine-guanine phosphoribosyltransferase